MKTQEPSISTSRKNFESQDIFTRLFGELEPAEPDGSMVGGRWFRRTNKEARITSKYSNEHYWLMIDGIRLLEGGKPICDFVRLYMRTTQSQNDSGNKFQSVHHSKHPHADTTSCMLNKDGRVLIRLDDDRQDDPYVVLPYSEILSMKPFCIEKINENQEFFSKFLFYLNENGLFFTYMDAS